MERRYRIITLLALAFFLVGLLMPACGSLSSPKQTETEVVAVTSPVPTETEAVPATNPLPTETEAAPVISQEQAEEELVAFMLEYIQQEKVPDTPEASIIMWGHVKEGSPPEIYYVGELIKVWWLENGQLSEREDKIEAIEQYRQEYVRDKDFLASWGEFEFGILSISENGRQAQIVLEASIRIDYAYAILFTLERGEAGQWEITDYEHLWIV